MVSLAEIKAFNSTLTALPQTLVAVVVGGTNGIGKAFLQQLASQTRSPKIYYVGRNETVLNDIKTELTSLNPSGTYIPIKAGDLTLLSSIEAATKQIASQESKIDILFQSQGFLTFAGRNESVEGLDKITSIRYYGRMRFIINLLPLLNAAQSPRVISVLAGGLEGKIFPDDLALKDPKNYGAVNAANVSATYTTVFMERLQKENPKISFVHKYPGFVRTNLFNTEHFGAVVRLLVGWLIVPTVGRLLGISAEESGMRALYAATNPKFASSQSTASDRAVGSNGQIGSGVYTLNPKDVAQHNDQILKPVREEGLDKKIWDHTMGEYKRVLGTQ